MVKIRMKIDGKNERKSEKRNLVMEKCEISGGNE